MTASTTYGSAQFKDAMKGTRLRANPPGHTVTTSSDNDEFDRFADLAEKLTRVPKHEVDEKRGDGS